MEDTDELAPALRLSQAEVVALAALLDATYLPGLGEEPLGDFTEEQVEAALLAAESGLRARGYVTLDAEGSPVVDEVVTALVGTCAFPAYSLVLTVNAADQAPRQHFFHHLDGLTVQHDLPEPGVHGFQVVTSGEELRRRLPDLLGLAGQEAPPCRETVVSTSVLAEARAMGRSGGPDAAREALLRVGVAADTAGPLAEALAAPLASAAVVALDHLIELEDPVRSFDLLQGREGFWLLPNPPADGEAPLQIRPVSAAEVAAELANLAGRMM